MSRKLNIKNIVVILLSVAIVFGVFPTSINTTGIKAAESENNAMEHSMPNYEANIIRTNSSIEEDNSTIEEFSDTVTIDGRVYYLGHKKGSEGQSTEKLSSNNTNPNRALAKGISQLPSKWDNTGFESYMPNLRDQGHYGSCWAQAFLGMAEISMTKKNIANKPNLSEVQFANFAKKHITDPLGLTSGDIFEETTPGQALSSGGYENMAINTLANWIGVAEEYGELVYPLNEAGEPYPLDPEYAYEDDVAHASEIIRINIGKGATINPNSEDFKAAKELILKNGALELTFYMTNGYSESNGESVYNETYNSYYDPCDYNGWVNHEVMIVGWDDNFPKENFDSVAPGDGAWLIRNSWIEGPYGSETQNLRGYFWMSYYNANNSSNVVSVEMESSEEYDNNYQYDGTLNHETLGNSNSIKGANVYKAKASDDGEELKAVSFFTRNTNVSYNVKVYVSTGSAITLNPESGTLVSTKTGTIACEGYHTIKLNSSVNLNKDEYFSVVVELSKTGNNNVGLEIEASDEFLDFVSIADMSTGQSFIENNGVWEDLYDLHGYGYGNLCIKAFTKNKFDSPVNLETSTDVHVMKTLYTGSALKPLITVRTNDGNNTLIPSSEYDITYSTNVWGNMSITIAAKAGSLICTGTKTVTYEILPANLAMSKKYYTLLSSGEDILSENVTRGPYPVSQPLWALTRYYHLEYNGITLEEGVDYDIPHDSMNTFLNVTENQTIYNIPLTGKGKYTGTKYIKVSLKPIDISINTFKKYTDNNGTEYKYYQGAEIANIPAQVYSPTGCRPSLTVTNITRGVLSEGVDYTVEYSGNTAVTGSAVALVKGKGNYTGTKEATFAIIPATITDTMVSGVTDQEYNNGNPVIISGLTVKHEGYTLEKGKDYSVTWQDNTVPGTAKVIICGVGNYTGSVEKTFTVLNPVAVITKHPAAKTLVYTGQKQKLIADGTAQNGQIMYAITQADASQPALTAFSAEVPEAKNAGTYNVWYYVKGSGIYLASSVNKISVVIKKAETAPGMPSSKISVPFSVSKVNEITLSKDWMWTTDDAGIMLEVGVPIAANAIYTGTDKDNYNKTEVIVNIERSQCEHTDTAVVNQKDRTHTDDGYSGDIYCKDCNQIITTGRVEKAEGHNYGIPDYEWAEDYSTCKGCVKCTTEGCAHVLEEISTNITIQSVYEQSTSKYTITYTAMFKNMMIAAAKKSVEKTAHKNISNDASNNTDVENVPVVGEIGNQIPGDTNNPISEAITVKEDPNRDKTEKDSNEKLSTVKENKNGTVTKTEVSKGENGENIKTAVTSDKDGNIIKTITITTNVTAEGSVTETKTETPEKIVTKTVTLTYDMKITETVTETNSQRTSKIITESPESKTVGTIKETPGKKVTWAMDVRITTSDGTKTRRTEKIYKTGTVKRTESISYADGSVVKITHTQKAKNTGIYRQEQKDDDGSRSVLNIRTTVKGNVYISCDAGKETKFKGAVLKSAIYENGKTVLKFAAEKTQIKEIRKYLKEHGAIDNVTVKRVK